MAPRRFCLLLPSPPPSLASSGPRREEIGIYTVDGFPRSAEGRTTARDNISSHNVPWVSSSSLLASESRRVTINVVRPRITCSRLRASSASVMRGRPFRSDPNSASGAAMALRIFLSLTSSSLVRARRRCRLHVPSQRTAPLLVASSPYGVYPLREATDDLLEGSRAQVRCLGGGDPVLGESRG